jgi:hypothetical protein
MSDTFWFSSSQKHDFNSFLELNCAPIVFIKPAKVSNSYVWRLYSADGKELAVADSRDMAFILARQNNFIPYSVH